MINRRSLTRNKNGMLFSTTVSSSRLREWKNYPNETIFYPLKGYGNLRIPMEKMLEYLELAKLSQQYDYDRHEFKEDSYRVEIGFSMIDPKVYFIGNWYNAGKYYVTHKLDITEYFEITNDKEWCKVLEGHKCQFCDSKPMNINYGFVKTISVDDFKLFEGNKKDLEKYQGRDRLLVVCRNCEYEIKQGIIKLQPNKFNKGRFIVHDPNYRILDIMSNHLEWIPVKTRIAKKPQTIS